MSGNPVQRGTRGRRRGSATALVLCAAFALLGAGCSSTDRPEATDQADGAAVLDGAYQSGGGEFVLKRVEETVPGLVPIHVELIGSNLQVDRSSETISLDVALRNVGAGDLYAPATAWLARFSPPEVTVTNADFVIEPADSAQGSAYEGLDGLPPRRWGFDYSGQLGDDGVLSPDETSAAKTWSFHVPGLTAFSFRAWVRFGLVPDRPRLGGLGFVDRNRNGTFDGGDTSHPYGAVNVTLPDGSTAFAVCGEDGRFALPVTLTGLYELLYDARVRCRCLVDYTTPNPLQVLLPPGPDGRPVSYLDANFGFAVQETDSIPPVVFWPGPLDSIPCDPYSYAAGNLDGDVLRLSVGFSGCGPDHPFAMYWQEMPTASPIPNVRLVLSHDDLGEMCDAFWQRRVAFDLAPMIEEVGGSLIVLHLRDFQGVEHRFEWQAPDRPMAR